MDREKGNAVKKVTMNITAARGIPEKVVGRLSLYRRILDSMDTSAQTHIFSHQLAVLAGVTSSQVRRDLLHTGYYGSPNRGYEVVRLADCLATVLDNPEGRKVALVGVGNLGRAIIAHFHGRRPALDIVAAFDNRPEKCDRLQNGVPVHPMERLDEVIASQGIRTAIITTPASAARDVAALLVSAGVRGILNCAATPLNLPPHVYVEELDITMLLEKVAYFVSLHKSSVKEPS